MPADQVSSEPTVQRELDLFDFLRVIAERRWFLWGLFLLCIAVGAAYSGLRERIYGYSVTLEIGQKTVNENRVLIETPDTVIAKLRETYLAAAVSDIQRSRSDGQPSKRYQLQARRPSGSDIVVVEGFARAADHDDYVSLLKSAVAAVVKDHSRIVDFERTTLDVELNRSQLERNQADLKLQDLLEQHVLLASQLKRLDQAENLLTTQVEQLAAQIQQSQALRRDAAAEATSQPAAMTVLLLNSELENDRTRLAGLERQLYIELKNEREQLRKAQADNRREQELQTQEITTQAQNVKAYELKKQAIIATRALAEPARSITPRGPGTALVMTLAGLLGVAIAGFSAVFITLWQTLSKRRG